MAFSLAASLAFLAASRAALPANDALAHWWAPQPAFQPLAPLLQAQTQAGTLDTLRAAPQPPAPVAPQTSSAQPAPLPAH